MNSRTMPGARSRRLRIEVNHRELGIMDSQRGWNWKSVVAGWALAVFALPAAAQKTQLLVYTALETDQIKAYEEAFMKANPTIEIKWVRDSTGVITAKLLAEKANPQADLVARVAASSLARSPHEGIAHPHAPTG